MIDTLAKNVAGYVGWAVLAVVVGVLQDVHRQLDGKQVMDWFEILDAAIVNLLPVLIVMLGAMKQPSVGHEEIADKAATHEDRLRVTDPAAPTSPPAPAAPPASVPRGAVLTEPVVMIPRGGKG